MKPIIIRGKYEIRVIKATQLPIGVHGANGEATFQVVLTLPILQILGPSR